MWLTNIPTSCYSYAHNVPCHLAEWEFGRENFGRSPSEKRTTAGDAVAGDEYLCTLWITTHTAVSAYPDKRRTSCLCDTSKHSSSLVRLDMMMMGRETLALLIVSLDRPASISISSAGHQL